MDLGFYLFIYLCF